MSAPAVRPSNGNAPPGAPLRLWCLLRDQFAHVRPIEEWFGARAEFIYDERWEPVALVAARPDLVLCVNDWPYDVARCLDAARGAGIPSLALQDGILEWRCQYENPLFGAGGGAPQHQPVLADRIACLGPQSARQIAAWGNEGRVDVTGMPRLDHLLARPTRERRRPGRCVLVMTAKNPGFTETQRAISRRSLEDVRAHLAARPELEVIWRVNREMAESLGVANLMRETSSVELAEVVQRSDAVITTPSTAMLEVMLLGRPVAALDYHNVPRFVPTAWTISASEHIAPVVAELLDPDARKMAFQRNCLDDALRCDAPAAPRVAALIERMVGRRASTGSPGSTVAADIMMDGAESAIAAAAFAPSTSAGSAAGVAHRPGTSLAELYPERALFAEHDVQALQVRLARLEKERERLQRALQHRSVAHRLYDLGRGLARRAPGRGRGGDRG